MTRHPTPHRDTTAGSHPRPLFRTRADAGAGHHVAHCVIGTERPGNGGYLPAKQTREELVEDSVTDRLAQRR
jgi:hypothetical protein